MSFKTMFPSKSKGKSGRSQETGDDDDIASFQRSFSTSQGAGTSSLFSSKHTVTTDGSSRQFSSSSYQKEGMGFTSMGRPLMILKEDVEDDTFMPNSLASSSFSITTGGTIGATIGHRMKGRKSVTSEDAAENASFNSIQSSESELAEFIRWKLNQLSNSMTAVMVQVSQSVLNFTRASISIGDLIQSTSGAISQHKFLHLLLPHQVTTSNSIGLRKVIKLMLHLLDNVLVGDVYDKSRSIVLKSFFELLQLLKLVEMPATGELTNFSTFLSPKLFPIGANPMSADMDCPNLKVVNSIMNSIILKKDLFSDQEGSFLAPVLRGFLHPDLSVVSFLFGFPELNRDHHDVIKFFSRQEEEIHFFSQKNSIVTASGSTGGLKAPFRTIDSNFIPMSMSISSNSSAVTSGTFGGYIYPKVPKGNSKLEKYRGKVFGMTCSHVVLNEGDVNEQGDIEVSRSNVSIPSPVLINMYKNALVKELHKFKVETSPEYLAFSRMIAKIDEVYPQRDVIMNGQKTMRNLPADEFGQVMWGERVVNEDRLSDLAIIKVSQGDKYKMINYLGDDLNISDPTIIMSNLNVKSVVSLASKSFGVPRANLPVFKVGSTTSYTSGRLNGMKMIYWSDGTLRSNEFVINAGDDFPFAFGGDSGSWILSKMSDVCQTHYDAPSAAASGSGGGVISAFIESFLPSITRRDTHQTQDHDATGLGVLGMLHSYDGEFKQLGLFTPMEGILHRLREITGIDWGVVGCEDVGSDEFDEDLASLTST